MSDEPVETNVVVDFPVAGEDKMDEQNSGETPVDPTADENVTDDSASSQVADEQKTLDEQTTDEQVSDERDADAGDDSPQLHVVSEHDEEDDYDDEEDAEEEGVDEGDVQPLELLEETSEDGQLDMDWYILKVQVNRENSICDALNRRVKVEGLERFFGEILVPTEDVREFAKNGKPRTVKRKLYPGYILVNMAINDDTWFIVRETPGIGDFTGSAGKPTPMPAGEVDRILRATKPDEHDEAEIKTTIKFKQGDRVRVKEGHFQNFEGEVDSIDETHGRITVMINIFGRPTPVELEHWHVEDV